MKRQNALLTICLFCLAILLSACGGGGGKVPPPSYLFIPSQPVAHELILSQDIFEINIGQTDNITVTLDNEDVTENAVYTPDDEGIATVEKGVIIAHNQGTTIVNVHVEGADEDKTFTVNVIDPGLPTLELSKTEINLGIGDTDNVTVTLEGKDVTEEVTYTTEDENIATVENGNIQAQYQDGETTVTVSIEGANNATFTVKVTDDSTQQVPLDSTRFNKLYDLGLVDKDYDHRTELTEINIPGAYKDNGTKYKITSIGKDMFYGCNLLKTVTMQNSIETIEDGAFCNCSSITEINIPNGVETIGSGAFNDCSSLEEITIPDSVTSLGHSFGGCSKLETITLGNGLTEIKNGQFSALSALKKCIIGEGVKTIGNGAFTSCSSLEEITIPDSVTSLGYAFDGCSKLETITLGNGLTEIKSGQFTGLPALKKCIIGDGVKKIGSDAFNSCTSLEKINIGDGVKEIGSYAFGTCILLELTIPDHVETIENDAFSGVKHIYYTANLQADKTNAPWGAKAEN